MSEHWLACLQVAQLLVLAPHHFGGVLVRARLSPVRDRWLTALEQIARQQGLSVPLRKIPSTITDENLLGGLDIESTLKQLDHFNIYVLSELNMHYTGCHYFLRERAHTSAR